MDDPKRYPPTAMDYDQLKRFDLRVGKITACTDHPNADKLLVLQVNVGDETRQICAAIKGHARPEDLIGQLVVVAVNVQPRSMRGVKSNGLVLTASFGEMRERVALVAPAQPLPPGAAVS
jgi:methionine--tRNA ligase beta chain